MCWENEWSDQSEFILDVVYRLFDMLDDAAIINYEAASIIRGEKRYEYKKLETKVGIANGIYLNNIEIDPLKIRAIMINEVVPSDPLQDFYGIPDADYLKTTIPLLQGAGTEVHSIQDILQMGIYITNAVKIPKTEYAIDKSSIENSLPYFRSRTFFISQYKGYYAYG